MVRWTTICLKPKKKAKKWGPSGKRSKIIVAVDGPRTKRMSDEGRI